MVACPGMCETCTLVVFYKLVQNVGSCLEFLKVVQMLRYMVFFQEFLTLQPINVVWTISWIHIIALSCESRNQVCHYFLRLLNL